MSIEGSINVSALFHDRDGTTAVKVVSLRSSDEYTTGKVAIVTGTATSQVNVAIDSYKDASGATVSIGSVNRVLFSWSGSSVRTLSEEGDLYFLLRSRSSEVAISSVPASPIMLSLESSGGQSGTYTIVLYGT